MDEQLDLVSFVWKSPTLNANDKQAYDTDLDLKLKLNGLSPCVASLCSELEDHFQELLKDFQYLGDSTLKDHISTSLVQEFEQFFKVRVTSSRNLFVGKFCTAITELCSTLWKLLIQIVRKDFFRILYIFWLTLFSRYLNCFYFIIGQSQSETDFTVKM